MDRDFGGSEAPTGPIDRDLGALLRVLGNSEAQKGPMDRDFGGPAALTGSMNRKFGTLWGLLGGLRSTDRADDNADGAWPSWPTGPMNRDFGGPDASTTKV